MIKYFRKIEKVINLIAVIAIIVVLVMVVLWFIGYSQAYYQELVPFIAFAAFVFFGYKVIILILSYYYQTEISKIASKLDAKRQKERKHRRPHQHHPVESMERFPFQEETVEKVEYQQRNGHFSVI